MSHQLQSFFFILSVPLLSRKVRTEPFRRRKPNKAHVVSAPTHRPPTRRVGTWHNARLGDGASCPTTMILENRGLSLACKRPVSDDGAAL